MLGASSCTRRLKENPNIVKIIVDQQAYDYCYQTPELKEWMDNLPGRKLLKQCAIEFLRHYCSEFACVPARGTLLTGQYDTLTGLSQTNGIAKKENDSVMPWLRYGQIPTYGNYFEEAGYDSRYVGKFHVSFQDITNPGTSSSVYSVVSYDVNTGVQDEYLAGIYKHADLLRGFGFKKWVGPECFGIYPNNTGELARTLEQGRDRVTTANAIKILKKHERKEGPLHLTVALVNPHDTVFYNDYTAKAPRLDFEIDPTLPDVPPPPTYDEDLSTKPTCQLSYKNTLPMMLGPITDKDFFRKLHYTNIAKADANIYELMTYLMSSPLYEDTIVIFVSDHGELLDSHGGLTEKWYVSYQENTHVPFMIHNPLLFNGYKTSNQITTHVDIMTTEMGLCGLNQDKLLKKLNKKFTNAKPLVGRKIRIDFDNPDAIDYTYDVDRENEPVLLRTIDNPSSGPHQIGLVLLPGDTKLTPVPYQSVSQPSGIETIVTDYESKNYKYSVYFDTSGSTTPVPNQYELYNLTDDPIESVNLAYPSNSTPETQAIQAALDAMLTQQKALKLLQPTLYNNPPNLIG